MVMSKHGTKMLATGTESPNLRLAKLKVMAKAICSVTIVMVMDTLQEIARNQSNQRVTEKVNKQKVGRKEKLKGKAKESPEPVITAGRKATSRLTAKAKAKASHGASNGVGKAKAVGQAKAVGKAKVLTKLTTVTDRPKRSLKLTLVEYG